MFARRGQRKLDKAGSRGDDINERKSNRPSPFAVCFSEARKFQKDLSRFISPYLASQLSLLCSFASLFSDATSSRVNVTRRMPCFRPSDRHRRSAYARQNDTCCCHVANAEPHRDEGFGRPSSRPALGSVRRVVYRLCTVCSDVLRNYEFRKIR